MANFYYYDNNGNRTSVTADELTSCAMLGLITPDTIIENEKGQKAPAGKVKGLTFPEIAPPKTSVADNVGAFSAAINAAMSNLSSSTPPVESNAYPTELYTFTDREQEEIDRFCAEHGHDVNARDEEGRTLLHNAAFEGNLAAVKFFVSKGINVNVQSSGNGDTPLHHAVFSEHVDVAKFLISKGANVNARNNVGWTPLHSAAMMPNTVTVIKLLVSAGVDVYARNNDGQTAPDLAKMCATEFQVDSEVHRYLSSLSKPSTSSVNSSSSSSSSISSAYNSRTSRSQWAEKDIG
jgi:hypothetical protein